MIVGVFWAVGLRVQFPLIGMPRLFTIPDTQPHTQRFERFSLIEAPVVGRVAQPSGDRDSNLPARTHAD